MAARPIMDPTKEPCGALTMVYRDYAFLKRWVDYYGAQFGRQHLYILSHGGDAEHDRIAEGCNVITVPRDPTLFRLERRRWHIQSHMSSGLLRYYNWMFVGDVDEVVVLDPAIGTSLIDYLRRYERTEDPENQPFLPKSICPFGVELIHNPEVEPEPITEDATVLSRRRVFRANANYAKPCIIRMHTKFTVGGHANTHQPRFLDPHLYLLHLRFFDYDTAVARLAARRDMRETMDEGKDPAKTGHAWKKDLDNYKKLAAGKPVREDCELAEFRRRMEEQKKDLHGGKVTFWGGGRTKELYSLPERFAAVF